MNYLFFSRNLPPSQGGRYTGFGNTVDQPKNDSGDVFSTLTSSLSSFTLNAGKWASVAKDNVVKLSSTAAQQATELSKNVNDKVKEGTLLSSLTYGVGNVSSKVTDVSSKAWSNINTYWAGGSGEQSSKLTGSNSNSGLFGRGGYNSVPGETGNSSSYNSYSGYNDDNQAGYESYNNYKDSKPTTNISNRAGNNNASNNAGKKDDWNSWDDASWENTAPSSNKNDKSSKNSSSKNNNKPAKSDLINFDDDSWETVS